MRNLRNFEEVCLLTSAQIRAARAMLSWSAEELSDRAGVSRRTLVNIENATEIPNANIATIFKIQRALEAAGIEFIGSPDDTPGIRIHSTRKEP